MRRKAGSLVPLEVEILEHAAQFARLRDPEFHGFGVAKEMQAAGGDRQLVAHGTLYKALNRLETAGYLDSRWEDADRAVEEGRPRRRLYRLTTVGSAALAGARATAVTPQPRPSLA